MSNLDFIYKRHSIRKFKDEVIPIEDLKEILKAATYAPSGKNLQNWHFVVVRDKKKVDEIVRIVESKNAEMAEKIQVDEVKTTFTKFLKYQTAFRGAPALILIYCGPYDPTGLEALKAMNASSEEIHRLLRTAPGVQGVSAAVENLMLAAATMGYGTCWMTGPNYAGKEISEFIGFQKEGYFLQALTPIGIPLEEDVKSPARKPVEEIMTIID